VGAWESLSHRVESAKCHAALFSRIRDETYSKLRQEPNRARRVPTSRLLGGPHIGGAPATPTAALSGSTPKAPGSAGGYLLVSAISAGAGLVNSVRQDPLHGARAAAWPFPVGLTHSLKTLTSAHPRSGRPGQWPECAINNGRNVLLRDHLTMQPRRQVHPRF
jgi:hypothetical protein